MTFNRRSLLAAGISLTALSAFGKRARPTAVDFNKLADKRRAMARLRTGPSGAGIWWYRGRLTELNDPTLGFVPCRLAYQTLGSFSDWMEMGDSPGVISWRISGEKIASRNALPAATAEWLAREHAELFAEMGAL